MDKTRRIIECYNQSVHTFVEKYMDLGKYEQYLREFSDCLKDEAKILDLGCGPGNIAKYLMNQKKGYQILGVDLSEEMLKIARQNVPDAEFVLSDIRYLSLPQKFDAVIVSFVLIHLDDSEINHLLQKIYNSLNTNGYLYLSFMYGGTPGFEKPDFSTEEMFFNYSHPYQMIKRLEHMGYRIISKSFQNYNRAGKMIDDVFIIALKNDSLF